MIRSIAFSAIIFPLLANADNLCGISPSIQKYENALNGTDDSSLKIIYGHESVNGDWPWLVNVGKYCTGSIVGEKWVLTAFHCGTTKGGLIFYGDVDVNKANNATVAKNFPFCPECHTSSDAQSYQNIDIMLLELQEPLTFAKSIKPICLTNEINSGLGDWEVVAGWGWNAATGGNPKVAREDKIPIEEPDYCSKDDLKNLTGTAEICAGTDDLGITPGDSGGPLMALKHGKWYQHGITSRGFGIPSGLPPLQLKKLFHRGIYTDVTKFCDWIEKTTKGEVQCEDDNIFE
uniref:Peptidase S1 domain-containing protein n=1 Tax=Panagrolaimus sp. JU765 TaxID=591449 RepID=A0AC34R5D4_9BILA